MVPFDFHQNEHDAGRMYTLHTRHCPRHRSVLSELSLVEVLPLFLFDLFILSLFLRRHSGRSLRVFSVDWIRRAGLQCRRKNSCQSYVSDGGGHSLQGNMRFPINHTLGKGC